MRHFTCLLVALCLFAGTICASDLPKLAPAEQEALNASQARRDATNRGDAKTAARYVSDDCLFSTEEGNLETKSQWLGHIGRLSAAYDRLENPRELVVRMHGNTIVINFRVTAHEQFGETDIISEQRRTETWIKQKGKWLLVAMQWDNVPVNYRKPVEVDPKIYLDYAGQYELRPNGELDTVSVKDGKLWTELDGEIQEYLPAGSDTFFVKNDLGSVTFSRDAQGLVTGYTYLRPDGQEIHAKKIK